MNTLQSGLYPTKGDNIHQPTFDHASVLFLTAFHIFNMPLRKMNVIPLHPAQSGLQNRRETIFICPMNHHLHLTLSHQRFQFKIFHLLLITVTKNLPKANNT